MRTFGFPYVPISPVHVLIQYGDSSAAAVSRQAHLPIRRGYPIGRHVQFDQIRCGMRLMGTQTGHSG
jgi:hypothetical protein